MVRLATVALAAALLAGAAPAYADTDCDAGYQTFIGKMKPFANKMSGTDLSGAIRKSLDAYNSCQAGDSFSPHGVWDQIIADMEAKAGK